MKSKFLIPHQYKMIGWIIFIPALVLAFLTVAYDYAPDSFTIRTLCIASDEIFGENVFFGFIETNMLAEILGILGIIGGIMVAFSKMKQEDEFIQSIRLNSLVWATYVNYIILLLAIVFVFSTAFLWVLMFNIYTLLIFFIARFYFKIYSIKNAVQHEE